VQSHACPGAKAWIVGIFTERPGPYFDSFPTGVIYTIEYEDGSSTEMHEADLSRVPLPDA
jgi:hypothetical protein